MMGVAAEVFDPDSNVTTALGVDPSPDFYELLQQRCRQAMGLEKVLENLDRSMVASANRWPDMTGRNGVKVPPAPVPAPAKPDPIRNAVRQAFKPWDGRSGE